MESSMARGPSGIIAEILKGAGEEGIGLARQLVDAVFSSSEIPTDWEEIFILNLCEGMAEALDRGPKLRNHVIKLL